MMAENNIGSRDGLKTYFFSSNSKPSQAIISALSVHSLGGGKKVSKSWCEETKIDELD